MELGPTDWPQGCLGYVFNLIRPTQQGHRRQLMHSAFNQVLVSSCSSGAAGTYCVTLHMWKPVSQSLNAVCRSLRRWRRPQNTGSS